MKKIKGFKGKYLISEDGKVYATYKTKEPKQLRTKLSNTGYEMISFTYLNKSYTFTIHSLVAQAYKRYKVGGGKTVNHKDGNKLNNHKDNLEIITRKENIQHAFDNGLYSTAHKVEYQGKIYRSKTAMRKALHIGERKQNKLIEKGEVRYVNNR